MNLAERAAATQATYNRYLAKPFSWRGATCVHVLRFHLRQMGHRPPPMPQFRSAIGATTALKAQGVHGLPGLCMKLGLAPIAPAEMIVGDVAIVPGDDGRTDGIFAALVICAGNKFMGWHGAADGFQPIDDLMPHVKTAFRA
jgi:hypothetical protein